MRYIAYILLALMPLGARAQTVITVTNAAYAPEPDPANPDHYVYATQGSVRLNVHVTDGDGGLPKDMSDIQNTGSFQLEVFDVLDDYRLQNVANTTTPEVDVSQGQVRFNISSLGARTYEVKGTAVPVTGTNEQYTIFWRYLTVTSAPSASAGSYSLSLINIDAQTVTATRVIADDLDVSGAIAALDSNAVHTYDAAWSNVLAYVTNALCTNIAFGVTNEPAGTVWFTNCVLLVGTNDSMGAASSVAIDWFTNQYAMIGYTNAAGEVIYPFDNVPADVVDNATWFYSYNGADPGLNNSNFGSWVSSVTNGMRLLEHPQENVFQPRMADWIVVPSGSVVRAAVYFPEPMMYAIFDAYRYAMGLGFWCDGTGNFHMPFDYESGSTGGQLRWLQFTSSFSVTVPTGAAGGFWGDHDYGISKSLHLIGHYPKWYAIDHDGTLTLRSYLGNSLDSLTLVGVRTNVPPITGIFVAALRAQTFGTTNGFVRYDNFNGEIGGRMWKDAGTYP